MAQRHLIKVQVSIPVEVLADLVDRFQELEASVVSVERGSVKTSISKISLGRLEVVLGGEEDHVSRRLSKNKYWLGRTSKFRRRSPSWMPQRA